MRSGIAPSPRRGEGWGEGARRFGSFLNCVHPHPTSPRQRSCQGFVSFSLEGEGSSGDDVAREQEFASDSFKNAVDVGMDIVVSEADDAVAMGLDQPGACGVSGAFSMLPSIKLDDQLGTSAGEISDIGAERKLADELEAFELSASQSEPEGFFDLSHIPAQSSCSSGQAFFGQDRDSSVPIKRCSGALVKLPRPGGERAGVRGIDVSVFSSSPYTLTQPSPSRERAIRSAF